MANDGRTFVKPGGLAQTRTNYYDKIKHETIEKNNKRMKSLGLNPLPTSLFPSIQPTTEGKRNVDSGDDGDKDYHPPEKEEGLSSSGDDDKFYGSQGKRFSRLEHKCARLEAHAKDIGYPLPPSPEEDSPIEYSRNGQNGSQQPCNVKHVTDPSGPQQQNGDNRFGFFSNWTDNEVIPWRSFR